MIIKVLLIVFLIIFSLYATSQYKRTKFAATVILLATFLGFYIVIYPESTTHFSQMLGVGRGVDLIFYIFMLILITVIFNLHLSIRAHRDDITQLSRLISLITARRPD